MKSQIRRIGVGGVIAIIFGIAYFGGCGYILSRPFFDKEEESKTEKEDKRPYKMVYIYELSKTLIDSVKAEDAMDWIDSSYIIIDTSGNIKEYSAFKYLIESRELEDSFIYNSENHKWVK